jgi:hypothetical protein
MTGPAQKASETPAHAERVPTASAAAAQQPAGTTATDEPDIVATSENTDDTDPRSAKEGAGLNLNVNEGEPKGRQIASVGLQRGSTPHAPQQNSHAQAEAFFSLRDRLPLQVFNEETRLQKLSHWGPMITSVASIVLTVFVWLSAQKLTEEQVALQSKQIQLQSEQAQAELADLRTRFFTDLTSQNETSRTLAELGLAGHGLKALPVIYQTLGVEQSDIRDSGVNVVYRLFQAQGTPEARTDLLQKLMDEVKSPNKTLQAGIVQSFVKLAPILHHDERASVVQFLQIHANPRDRCADNEGRNMLHEAVNFFGNDALAVPHLLNIARYPQCGKGWIQAMLNLESAASQLAPPERADLLKKIDALKSDVLFNLPKNVSAESLNPATAFGAFLKPGEVDLTFEQFQGKVVEEFDKLRQSLGAQ